MTRTHARQRRSLYVFAVVLAVLTLACGFSGSLDDGEGESLQDLMALPSGPGGQIAEASRTPACREELRAALETLRTEQGMAYTVEEPHVESLVTTGSVALSYVRDGVTFTPHFGIDSRDAGCQVRYWQRETRRPGHQSSEYFLQFATPLSVCQCAP